MTVTLFVAASNGNASAPGAANRQVQLRSVKPEQPKAAVPATATTPAVPAIVPTGPNYALFDNPQNGSVDISFNQITQQAKSFFEEGATYVVTFEKVATAPAS
jgi:hypothetical protein